MIAYRQSALRNFWHKNGLKCRRTPSMYMQTTLGPLGSVHIHLHSWSIESTELLYIKKMALKVCTLLIKEMAFSCK